MTRGVTKQSVRKGIVTGSRVSASIMVTHSACAAARCSGAIIAPGNVQKHTIEKMQVGKTNMSSVVNYVGRYAVVVPVLSI